MFGKRLKQLRAETNRTQEETAKLLGLSRSAYSHIENERNQPDTETLAKVSDLYSVTIDYLLGKSNNRNLDGDGYTIKEEKDMKKRIEDLRKDVKSQEGLLFDGEPMSDDAVDQLLDIIEFAEKQATKLNRRFTTKDNRKKYDE